MFQCSIYPLQKRQKILIAKTYPSARIAGMTHDLHLIGNDYQWLLTIFYITYIIFEFQALMWKIVPPQYVILETKSSSGPDPGSWDLSWEWWLLQTCFMAQLYSLICQY